MLGVASLHKLGDQYRTLASQAESATERLIKVAYEGVMAYGLKEFAAEVGEPVGKIQGYVSAYAEFVEADGERTANDALEVSRLKGDDRIAKNAVAQAWGISIDNARKAHKMEVAEVKKAVGDYQQQVAEMTPADRAVAVTAEEYALKLAKAKRKRIEAQRARQQELKDEAGEAFHALTNDLSYALQYLRDGAGIVRESELPTDYAHIVTTYIEKCRAALSLIELAAGGSVEVDWDAEMQRLGDPS